MRVKVHKVTLLIVDHDNLGKDGITQVLEAAHYPNHCIYPSVKTIETREVNWSDEHPLNDRRTAWQEFKRLFP